MLTKTKKITLEGRSIIDGNEIAGFVATIDSTDPKNINFSSWQINKDLYKQNRVEVRADEAEFEDYAYSIQDSMLEEQAAEIPETIE